MINKELTNKFFKQVPDGLPDAEILELLLQFSEDDAAAIAQELLARFPTIANLMEAGIGELSAVESLSKHGILLLRLVYELQKRYFLSLSPADAILTDSAAFGRYLLPHFYGARDELVYILMLDAACKVINCRMIGRGSVNSANVPIRKLVQEAINANASAIVLAHNHPSGIALPSKEDIEITHLLADALRLMEITLLDHIVVADDDFVSLYESGYLYR